jgi:hypothetical protein
MTGAFLIALLSLLMFSGCMVLRPSGPCYGVGCHAFTVPQGSQAQNVAPANSTQAQDRQAPNTEAQNTEPAASQHPHGLKALLQKVKL